MLKIPLDYFFEDSRRLITLSKMLVLQYLYKFIHDENIFYKTYKIINSVFEYTVQTIIKQTKKATKDMGCGGTML